MALPDTCKVRGIGRFGEECLNKGDIMRALIILVFIISFGLSQEAIDDTISWEYADTCWATYISRYSPYDLWYNYKNGKIEYDTNIEDDDAALYLFQSPNCLDAYKWLRKKGYRPSQAIRRANKWMKREFDKIK